MLTCDLIFLIFVRLGGLLKKFWELSSQKLSFLTLDPELKLEMQFYKGLSMTLILYMKLEIWHYMS